MLKLPTRQKPSGVIDPAFHAELLARKDEFARAAGIPASFIERPLADYCSKEEVEWVRHSMAAREEGCAGLMLVGSHSETKLLAIAAAYLRHYINAKVITVTAILQLLDQGEDIYATVLIVPRFCGRTDGKAVPAWQQQRLYDVLFERFAEQRLTILQADALPAVKLQYGDAIYDHLATHYHTL
jgi:hypothetical protein